ncbi:hypothetical protein PCK2_000815 [Pneumocystis canis]|nr:hypothetical protein PCK2_000815 [Pneumocystis canis]
MIEKGTAHGFSPCQEARFTIQSLNEQEWNVQGETSRFHYTGTTKTSMDPTFFTYGLAIINPETHSADLIPVSLIHLKCHVKAQNISFHDTNEKDYKDQKEALSKEFGSKRAKKAIHHKALHTIHTDQLNEITFTNTKYIPSIRIIIIIYSFIIHIEPNNTETHNNPLIPPPNKQTTNPEEVYSLSDIISADELTAIHITPILQESNERARVEYLPFKFIIPMDLKILLMQSRNSRYINEHLTNLLAAEKKNKRHIKILYYASLLMAFYTNRHLISKKELISKKLGNPPLILIDHLIQRFSEPNRSGMNHETIQAMITSYGADKILCYLFTLCLIIDNFSVDINPLVQDLSLSTQKCKELFKTLGCKIQGCTETQRLSMNLSKAEAKMYKKAVLMPPFEFAVKKQKRSR